jgi:hypothetical protein
MDVPCRRRYNQPEIRGERPHETSSVRHHGLLFLSSVTRPRAEYKKMTIGQPRQPEGSCTHGNQQVQGNRLRRNPAADHRPDLLRRLHGRRESNVRQLRNQEIPGRPGRRQLTPSRPGQHLLPALHVPKIDAAYALLGMTTSPRKSATRSSNRAAPAPCLGLIGGYVTSPTPSTPSPRSTTCRASRSASPTCRAA